MEINLGIGLADIKFGSKQNEIEKLLGEPDAVKQDEEYEEFEPMLQYNSIKSRWLCSNINIPNYEYFEIVAMQKLMQQQDLQLASEH